MSFSRYRWHILSRWVNRYRNYQKMLSCYHDCKRFHFRTSLRPCIRLHISRRSLCKCRFLCLIFCRSRKCLGKRLFDLLLMCPNSKIGSFSWTHQYIRTLLSLVSISRFLSSCDHLHTLPQTNSQVQTSFPFHEMHFRGSLLRTLIGRWHICPFSPLLCY